MVETINYASQKEGLIALDRFVERKSRYADLLPFSLPVIYKKDDHRGYRFDYRVGFYKGGGVRYLTFHLSEEQISSLGELIYALPHSEVSIGQNPYYWLTLHSTPEVDSHALASCRLRPEEETHQIDFRTWHGLEERLLVDYILGLNNLKFTNLSPFNVMISKKGVYTSFLEYYIGGVSELLITFRKQRYIQDNNNFRFIPRTDDQKLFEWLDILQSNPLLPEEMWTRISSYRILSAEHRIYSMGWFGSDRQLLIERMQGKPEIKFYNLRPIRAKATAGGETVYFFPSQSTKLRGYFNIEQGILVSGEETISIPNQDDQGLYEWLELYKFEPLTNNPIGEVIASARITSEGINQRSWIGVEKQLLKDYTNGLLRFEHLRPVTIRVGEYRDQICLWWQENKTINLPIQRGLNQKTGDELTLIPEKETEEGTDFFLVKDSITLARYRLDLKTKKFKCIDNLISLEQSSETSISPQEAHDELMKLLE